MSLGKTRGKFSQWKSLLKAVCYKNVTAWRTGFRSTIISYVLINTNQNNWKLMWASRLEQNFTKKVDNLKNVG